MAEAAKDGKVQKWTNAIAQYEKDFKKWETRAEKIQKRYRDDSRTNSNSNTAKFNILWSNVQTIVPAVFARLPKPDVSRRFRDNDPVGRVAALILERALEFEIEHYPDYRAAMKNSVLDRFLGGRGVSWARYEPHITAQPGVPEDGLQVTEDADEAEIEAVEVVEYECAPTDYVHWKDFGHTQGRCWEEVTAVWRKVYMRRPALIERFGEEQGNKIPLDTKPDEQKRGGYQDGGEYEACIYEIWDKETASAMWMSKSMPEMLDEKEDPLGLEQFFPCPKPLYATLTTDSLIPVPDFTLYQDQAATLDVLCERIDGLVNALKVRGVHDASIAELTRLFTEGNNNDLIPVKNWSAFVEKQGLKGAIDLVDLTPIFNALTAAYQAMEQQKAQIYEITGLSDIVRGQGDAGETATAQKLKGQYASLRLKSLQGEVGEYAQGLLQLKAQIICTHFQPQSIMQMAAVTQFAEDDKQYIERAIQLLKDGALSDFRIDVSADSLVQIDEDAEKQAATELVTTIGGFMKSIAEAPPETIPFLIEMLKFVFARYKIGKTIEGALDQLAEKAKQKAAQPAAPPPPDPAIQKQEMIEQGKAQQAQMDQQAEERRMAMEAQQEQQRMAMEQQHEREVAEREQQQAQIQAMLDQQAQKADHQFQMLIEQMDQRFQLLMQSKKDETTLEVAQLSAQTTLDAAETSAANTAASD